VLHYESSFEKSCLTTKKLESCANQELCRNGKTITRWLKSDTANILIPSRKGNIISSSLG